MTDIPEIDPSLAREHLDAGQATFVDVRDPDSHRRGRIPGSVSLGNHNLKQFLADTDREKPVVVYCYNGYSSQSAVGFLRQRGLQAMSLRGGFNSWQFNNPVER